MATAGMERYLTSGIVSPGQLLDVTTSLEYRPSEGTAAAWPVYVTVERTEYAPTLTDLPAPEVEVEGAPTSGHST